MKFNEILKQQRNKNNGIAKTPLMYGNDGYVSWVDLPNTIEVDDYTFKRIDNIDGKYRYLLYTPLILGSSMTVWAELTFDEYYNYRCELKVSVETEDYNKAGLKDYKGSYYGKENNIDGIISELKRYVFTEVFREYIGAAIAFLEKAEQLKQKTLISKQEVDGKEYELRTEYYYDEYTMEYSSCNYPFLVTPLFRKDGFGVDDIVAENTYNVHTLDEAHTVMLKLGMMHLQDEG